MSALMHPSLICPDFPQLDFTLDTRPLRPHDWVALGEIEALVQALRVVPLTPAVAQRLHRTSIVKGAVATTSIEGNTLSEVEVRRVLDGEFDAHGARRYQQTEVENTLRCFNETVEFVATHPHPDPAGFVDLICHWNRVILEGLSDVLEDHVVPGGFKTVRLGVGRSPTPGPAYVAPLMTRLASWISELQAELRDADLAPAARYLIPIVAHAYFEAIHPFGDGNGRTGRMLEFYLLLRAGVPTIAAHLTSSHYNETRDHGYYPALERFSVHRDITPFLRYALCGFRDQLRRQLDEVREHEREVAWRNYVHEVLPAASAAAARQRSLVLALADRRLPFARGSRALDPADAVSMYFMSTPPKTRTRDLNTLQHLGLIEVTPRTVRARVELIDAFMPRSFGEPDRW